VARPNFHWRPRLRADVPTERLRVAFKIITSNSLTSPSALACSQPPWTAAAIPAPRSAPSALPSSMRLWQAPTSTSRAQHLLIALHTLYTQMMRMVQRGGGQGGLGASCSLSRQRPARRPLAPLRPTAGAHRARRLATSLAAAVTGSNLAPACHLPPLQSAAPPLA
jgi:hypothetical protein